MTMKYRVFHRNWRPHIVPTWVMGWSRAVVLRCSLFLLTAWLFTQELLGAAPGANFDLSHWSLTLPDSAASVISPAELTAGFSNSYFYTGTDGAMVFWAP